MANPSLPSTSASPPCFARPAKTDSASFRFFCRSAAYPLTARALAFPGFFFRTSSPIALASAVSFRCRDRSATRTSIASVAFPPPWKESRTFPPGPTTHTEGRTCRARYASLTFPPSSIRTGKVTPAFRAKPDAFSFADVVIAQTVRSPAFEPFATWFSVRSPSRLGLESASKK